MGECNPCSKRQPTSKTGVPGPRGDVIVALEPPAAPVSPQRAIAERDALLELIAIFTHDLSNPLQSITVLCELGLDDAPEGSDDQLRAQQCLEAAQRMRALLQGLSGLSRYHEGAYPLSDLVDRAIRVLVRRFDRHNTDVEVDLGSAGLRRVPAAFEFALLTICLGFLAAAAEASALRNSLSISAIDVTDAHVRLQIRSIASDNDQHTEPLELPSSYVTRVTHIVSDLGGALTIADDYVCIDVPPPQTNEVPK